MEIVLGSLATLFTAAAPAAGTAAAVGSVAAPLAVIGGAGPLAVPTFMGTAAAGATAGGGLLGALTSGSVLSSVLSGATTALSALRALDAGKEKAMGAQFQAMEADNQAADERATGVRRRIGLKEEMYKVLGQNDVKTAAAGLDLSYGFGKDLREQTLDKGTREIGIDLATENTRVADLKARAANYRRMARGYRDGSSLSAALAAAEGVTSILGRFG